MKKTKIINKSHVQSNKQSVVIKIGSDHKKVGRRRRRAQGSKPAGQPLGYAQSPPIIINVPQPQYQPQISYSGPAPIEPSNIKIINKVPITQHVPETEQNLNPIAYPVAPIQNDLLNPISYTENPLLTGRKVRQANSMKYGEIYPEVKGVPETLPDTSARDTVVTGIAHSVKSFMDRYKSTKPMTIFGSEVHAGGEFKQPPMNVSLVESVKTPERRPFNELDLAINNSVNSKVVEDLNRRMASFRSREATASSGDRRNLSSEFEHVRSASATSNRVAPAPSPAPVVPVKSVGARRKYASDEERRIAHNERQKLAARKKAAESKSAIQYANQRNADILAGNLISSPAPSARSVGPARGRIVFQQTGGSNING